MNLHYNDRHRLPAEVEEELGLTFHDNVESLVSVCDVVSIHCPLHPETEHMFDDELIGKMKRGSYIVNTARGKICDRDAIVRALESGQLAGYAGDVWFPQPPPNDHPWRTAPNHALTPHTSGTSLSAQARYAAGVRGNPGVLVRRPADQGRIPDSAGRRAGRHRRPLLQRRRRHRRLGRSGGVHGDELGGRQAGSLRWTVPSATTRSTGRRRLRGALLRRVAECDHAVADGLDGAVAGAAAERQEPSTCSWEMVFGSRITYQSTGSSQGGVVFEPS